MKRIYFILILLVSSNYSYSQNDTTNRIFWSDSMQLNWDDFKTRNTFKENTKYTFLAIHIRLQLKQTRKNLTHFRKLEIGNIFDRNRSWVDQNSRLPFVLKYAQLQFDIHELAIRKLKKRLMESNSNSYYNLSKIEKLTRKELSNMMRTVEQETNQGMNSYSLLFWQNKIYCELTLLSGFSGSPAILYFD